MSTPEEPLPESTASEVPPLRLKPADDPEELRIRRMARRGFVVAGASAFSAIAGSWWLVTRSEEDGLPWPLRKVLRMNERIARATFGPSRLARSFPRSSARQPRANGQYGLESAIDLDAWRLQVTGPAGSRTMAIDQIRALPRTEMTTELKCIEGWSTIVHWAGARLSDLASLSGLATRSGGPPNPANGPNDLFKYVAMTTPDGAYYVGLDTPSAMHPQTLLAYEMNGRDLSLDHGAPLRLVVPVKYGIKHIKRIGSIKFTDSRPADFWAEQGYDWHAGH